MVKFYITPFALSGDKATIPETDPGNGSINYTIGYGVNYSKNRQTDPSALNVARVTFNELMFDVTANLQQYQTHGTPEFITTADNDGSPYPYAKDARVRYFNGTTNDTYISLADGNTNVPTDAAHWIKENPNGVSDADYGDIVVSGGGSVWTIDAGVVTNAKLANMAALTFKARMTNSAGAPQDITPAQALALMIPSTSFLRTKCPPITTWVNANSISVSAGTWFSTDQGLFINSTAMTKLQTAVWAAGTGNGGMLGGAVKSANQTLHMFAIWNGTSTDYGYATVATGPTLPTGYTDYRRIASFKTDSSGNFVQYIQNANKFNFAAGVDISAAIPRTTSLFTSLFLPTGVVVEGIWFVQNAGNGATGSTPQTLTAPGNAAASLASNKNYNVISITGTIGTGGVFTEITNSSAQIMLGAAGSGTFVINCIGYTDYRGTLD